MMDLFEKFQGAPPTKELDRRTSILAVVCDTSLIDKKIPARAPVAAVSISRNSSK